jgi:16S rRNA (cytidine1402-2'-O)-methyltransferase
MLYLVATPIGNLGDFSFRAVEVLKSVALIACEDTRHSKILFDHYGISTPATSYTQHNKTYKGAYLIRFLSQGKSVALVSDAGTPGILDPGYHLINLAIKHKIPLTVIPGPAAFINALVLSGKPTHRFIFEGFLPNKPGARLNRLKELAKFDTTVVFYESCHRISSTLKDVEKAFGDRQIVCARELTKKFEEVIRARPAEISAVFESRPARGEFIVVI